MINGMGLYWSSLALPAMKGFSSDGAGFIHDFERLLHAFCLSLACLTGKRRRGEEGWRLWERIDRNMWLCPIETGGWRYWEDVWGSYASGSGFALEYLSIPNPRLQRFDFLFGRQWGRFLGWLLRADRRHHVQYWWEPNPNNLSPSSLVFVHKSTGVLSKILVP